MIARQLYAKQVHAELYETVEELIDYSPSQGVVLISDDQDMPDTGHRLDSLRLGAAYLPVAMFSSAPRAKKIVDAMASGALDYLEWPCSPEALIDTVDRIADVGQRRARTDRLRSEARRLVATLTPREKDVLRAVVDGSSNKQLAMDLGISPRTVELHRANMTARLGAQSTADAVRIGLYAEIDV